jgi:hypothetical protein
LSYVSSTMMGGSDLFITLDKLLSLLRLSYFK